MTGPISLERTDLETLGTQRHRYHVPLEQNEGRDGLELSLSNDLVLFQAIRIFFES